MTPLVPGSTVKRSHRATELGFVLRFSFRKIYKPTSLFDIPNDIIIITLIANVDL